MYTQPRSLTKEEIEKLLKEAPVVRLCSLNEDGTIHAVPMWFQCEDGWIIIRTPAGSRKARNANRNKNPPS